MPRQPAECSTMSEVREGVDATDRELIALLDHRFGYMRAASRIKQSRGQVRDEDRKAAVIEAARLHAEGLGLPATLIASIWDDLVEGSIAYELDAWDKRASK